MLLFLIGGIIHIAAWGIDGLNNITELYFCTLLLVWSISIQKRITEPKIRFLLIKCIIIMLLTYILQTCRFLLMTGLLTVNRYLIYADYVAGIFQASLFLEIGLRLTKQKENNISYRHIYIPAIVLSLFIFTNDFHQFFIFYPDGLSNAKTSYNFRAGLFVFYGWVAALYISYIVLVLRNCRVASGRKYIWLPLSFPIIGGILLFLHVFNLPKINGHVIWQIEDIMLLIIVGLAESCIELGLIPSNTDYNRLFRLSKNKAVITDHSGKVIYSSSDEMELPPPDEDTLVNTRSIHGGQISWTVDLSALNKLNRQLQETTERINLRNDYLRHQNEFKEEKALLDARNTLYDRISSIVRPQLDTINSLLPLLEHTSATDKTISVNDESFSDPGKEVSVDDESLSVLGKDVSESADTRVILARIAVLNAYIKRRSNMELLRADSDTLTLKELFTALSESCEYIKLNGIMAAVLPVTDKSMTADTVITVYDFFENIVEAGLGRIASLMVRISSTENGLTMRILTDTILDIKPAAALYSRLEQLGARYTFESEEAGSAFLLTIPEGGAASC